MNRTGGSYPTPRHTAPVDSVPTDRDETGEAPPGGRWQTVRALAEPRLDGVGDEPDPRYTFANERTFLAWNRTALALIAAGLAAAQFLRFHLHDLRLLIAVPLIALGSALSLRSYRQWVESERAMRLGQPLGYSRLPRILAGGIAVIALFGVIVAIIDRIIH